MLIYQIPKQTLGDFSTAFNISSDKAPSLQQQVCQTPAEVHFIMEQHYFIEIKLSWNTLQRGIKLLSMPALKTNFITPLLLILQ